MTDLETRLRDALHDAARTVEPTDVTLAGIAPARSRRRRAWVVAPIAVAAIVALVVATVALWPSHDDRTVHVTGGPAGPVAFVPTNLPDGWRITGVGLAPAVSNGFVCTDGSYASGRLACRAVSGSVAWGAVGPSGRTSTIQTTAGDDSAVVAEIRRLGTSTPTEVRGHPGDMVRASGSTALTWQERPGLRVAVFVPAGAGIGATTIADHLRAEPVPLPRVPVVVATADDVSVVARPTDPGTCIGLVVRGGVMPCRYSEGDTARTFSYRGLTVVYGAITTREVARVRVTLGLGTAATHAHVVSGLRGAFFALLIPSSMPPEDIEALDGSGHVVERIPASAIDVGAGSPFTSHPSLDPSAPVVATTSTGARLRASWSDAGVCVGIEEHASIVESACGPASDVGSMVQGTGSNVVFGAVSDGVTSIRAQPVEGPATTLDVAHDVRFPFGFYVFAMQGAGRGYALTMLDAQGRVVAGGGMSP